MATAPNPPVPSGGFRTQAIEIIREFIAEEVGFEAPGMSLQAEKLADALKPVFKRAFNEGALAAWQYTGSTEEM